jgi:hypothetical protein
MLKNTWRLCAVALLLAPLLTSCDSEGDGKGDECQPCRDSAPQCDSGMSCATFDGPFGKDYQRCAKPSTRTCDVP